MLAVIASVHLPVSAFTTAEAVFPGSKEPEILPTTFQATPRRTLHIHCHRRITTTSKPVRLLPEEPKEARKPVCLFAEDSRLWHKHGANYFGVELMV